MRPIEHCRKFHGVYASILDRVKSLSNIPAWGHFKPSVKCCAWLNEVDALRRSSRQDAGNNSPYSKPSIPAPVIPDDAVRSSSMGP